MSIKNRLGLCQLCIEEHVKMTKDLPKHRIGAWSFLCICLINLHTECLERCLMDLIAQCPHFAVYIYNNMNSVFPWMNINYENKEFSINKFIDICFTWRKCTRWNQHDHCEITGIFGLNIPAEMMYPLIIEILDKLYPGKNLIGTYPEYITLQLTINRPHILPIANTSANNLLYIVNQYQNIPYDIWHMIAEFTCTHKLYHRLNFQSLM